MMRPIFGACLIAGAVMCGSGACRADPAPLRVVVHDGDILFQGQDLDIDQLRDRLAATGRQTERLYFQVGANAKSAFISRVLHVLGTAGFTQIVIVGPDGITEVGPPEKPVD